MSRMSLSVFVEALTIYSFKYEEHLITMKGRFFVTALMTGVSIILMSCAAPFHITDVEEANVELTIESMDEESHEVLENNGHFFCKSG